MTMSGFADASLGDDPGCMASRIGTVVLVNGGFVCGKSSKLKRVQISSTGSELQALSLCAHEVVAMRNQLAELGHDMAAPTIVRGDNTSSIMAANNPGQRRSQLRHLELHAWAVRDLVREGQVRLLWCSTEENPADLLTKAIQSPSKFSKFQAVLLGNAAPTTTAALLAARGNDKKVRCFLLRRHL